MTNAGNDPLLIFIPGGPGLLSDSISDLLPHFSAYDFICADPIDDGSKLGYENLLRQLEVLLPRDRDVVLCGHSFGGILAGDMALRSDGVKALICMATPFSNRAWKGVGDQYNRNATPALDRASELFEREPNDTTFRNWIANYGVLYFAPTNVGRGKEMLLNCQTNLRAFEDSGAEASQKEYVLKNLNKLSIPRLFIAGKVDQLVTVESARAEAEVGGFDFVEIENAGHFMMFDEPLKTANVIKKFLSANLNYQGNT